MSFLDPNADPFADPEVVTTDKVDAPQIHLKSVPSDSTAAMNWSDPPSSSSFDAFEAPFHIHQTDEPSFKPMVMQESPRSPPVTSEPAPAPQPPTVVVDTFDYPLPSPAKEPSKHQTEVTSSSRPRASISPRVAVGGVPFGVDSLLSAVKKKDVESARSLLKQGMNPNAQNEENQTALHLAVLAQSVEIVKILLECPVLDPNMVDIAFNTPLHIATCHCDAPIRCSPDLSELVPAPTSADATTGTRGSNSSSTSATMLVPASTVNDITGASDSPLEAIIRLLCADARVDVNIRNTSLHVPLIYSCLNGNYKVAALLVKAGASVNAATHTDIYPLHAASENGYADIVRLLVLNGALVNVRDYQGFTPLHLAARSNFGAICGLLWRHRADINALTLPNARNPVGKRPCDLATDPEIKNFLSGMKTSSSHPLEINFVTHPVLGKSRIGMTMCPGRNKKDHRRNLKMDIAALLQVGTQVLVSLVQQHELDSMKIPDMMTRVRAAGIEVIHAPIKDKWIPSRIGILVELVDLIAERVKLGKCITVHCNGGKGRTGLVVAGTLVLRGMEPGPATDLIRQIRPGMLYNPAQIVYLRLYQRTINGREAPTGALTSIPTELAVFEATGTTKETEDDSCNKPSQDEASSSAAGDVGSSHMEEQQLTVLPPASASRTNLGDIQSMANAQERAEQPDLPVGEQKPFIVGSLIDEDPMPSPLAQPTQTPTNSSGTNPFL